VLEKLWEHEAQTLPMATGFDRSSKRTQRAVSLSEMEPVAPCAEFCALIAATFFIPYPRFASERGNGLDS
jgi:hypothetical protein